MGNRKQKLKKYLGVNEYPWSSSSDDEEDQQPNQEARQRRDRRPHNGTADTPGPSGSQPQPPQVFPLTARNLQDKKDRDLFWSIINGTQRSMKNIPSARARVFLDLGLAAACRSTPNHNHSARSREEERNPEERTDSRRTDTTRTDTTRTDTTRTDTTRTDTTRTDARRTDTTRTDTARTDTTRTDNTRTDNPRTDNTRTDNTRTDNTRTDNTRTDNTRTDNMRTDNTRTDNARMDRQPTCDVQRLIAFKRLSRSLHQYAHHRGCANRPTTLPETSLRASRPQERPGPASDVATCSAPGPSPGRMPTAAAAPAPAPAPAPASTADLTSVAAAAAAVAAAAAPIPISGPAGAPTRHVGPCVGASPTEMLASPSLIRYGCNAELPWRRSLPLYPPPITNQLQSPRRSDWSLAPQQMLPDNELLMAASGTSQMSADVFGHGVELHDGEDETPNSETGSGARLIEEVVEVDAPDETDNNPPPPGTEGEEETTEPTAVHTNSAGTSPEDNAGPPQQGSTYQGMKRKRDTADEASELLSVHEFNQSLLRLLECPVCLEWMEPPISQCRRGHLVCSRCRTRLTACPVCRTPFSSVRNRAMEGVAEVLRYPCRHGCGREVRLRRRAPHEASCAARRYHCPAPACVRHPALPRDELAHHFQCKHRPILKIGNKHKFAMKMNMEHHDTWIIMALDEYFQLRVDVDMRSWGIIVFLAYIGPKKKIKSFIYEVIVKGHQNAGKLTYIRTTHSDLDSSAINLNMSRQNCFHLIPEQVVNYIRFKNRPSDSDKILDFEIEITKREGVDDTKEESDP